LIIPVRWRARKTVQFFATNSKGHAVGNAANSIFSAVGLNAD